MRNNIFVLNVAALIFCRDRMLVGFITTYAISAYNH
jgi:hypothetical protein